METALFEDATPLTILVNNFRIYKLYLFQGLISGEIKTDMVIRESQARALWWMIENTVRAFLLRLHCVAVHCHEEGQCPMTLFSFVEVKESCRTRLQ